MTHLFSSRAAWTRRADVFVVALAVIGLGLTAINERSRRLSPQPHLNQKMAAATRTVRCFETIRQARLGIAEAMDPENDPSGSGLIGQEFTLTTTDRGILEAKLTSVNPNFAALFVQYFHDLELRPGDAVAIAMTGSFPALNIAALAAAEEMNLRPIVIASVGASMWGANDPEFSWLDMERLLNERGLLRSRSVAASFGGTNDRGRGLSPRGRELLGATIDRNDIPVIHELTLEDAVTRRVEIFDATAGEQRIQAYVNIGGGAASIGTSLNGNLIPPGVNRVLGPYNWAQRGALHQYARRGVPIVHILKVESIALDHGFPLAPELLPPVGEGEIFHREVYDLRVTIPAFVTYIVLCAGVLWMRRRAVRSGQEVPVRPEVREATPNAAGGPLGPESRA